MGAAKGEWMGTGREHKLEEPASVPGASKSASRGAASKSGVRATGGDVQNVRTSEILRLQRSAGNSAVVGLLRTHATSTDAVVRRDGTGGPTSAATAAATATAATTAADTAVSAATATATRVGQEVVAQVPFAGLLLDAAAVGSAFRDAGALDKLSSRSRDAKLTKAINRLSKELKWKGSKRGVLATSTTVGAAGLGTVGGLGGSIVPVAGTAGGALGGAAVGGVAGRGVGHAINGVGDAAGWVTDLFGYSDSEAAKDIQAKAKARDPLAIEVFAVLGLSETDIGAAKGWEKLKDKVN
jgi:hypothetical protein